MAGDIKFGPLKLLVGLGNPGRKYADTRHNVGFMVLDRLAQRLGVSFEKQKKLNAEWSRDSELFLVKPRTFMNESGRSVRAAMQFYKISWEQLLIVYDDVDLPLGSIRMRPGGGAGGHNGMRSIISAVGTDRFARLRVGIGRPGGQTSPGAVGHVLGKFSASERSELEKCLDTAVLAVTHVRNHGLQAAMNVFNRKPETETPHPPTTPPADTGGERESEDDPAD